MFVDASVLTALVTGEGGSQDLAAQMEPAPARITSAEAVWEAIVAVSRILQLSVDDAREQVEGLLAVARIDCIPIDLTIGLGAVRAFDRFGKGRHPAKLNLGDCFAYACARHFRMPLLFKGEDFSKTDIEAA